MTVHEWLQGVARDATSTDADSAKLQALLHRCGFPTAVVTCGVVYLDGTQPGQPLSIQQVAQRLTNPA